MVGMFGVVGILYRFFNEHIFYKGPATSEPEGVDMETSASDKILQDDLTVNVGDGSEKTDG
jgi:hypothetical protein